METTEKTIEVLNDLIQINNDRTAGFERAEAALDEQDISLAPVFSKLANESRNNASELSALISRFGGEAEDGTSFSGTLHRTWLSVAATFTGNDRESILTECERGEDAIKGAYRSALEDRAEISPEIVDLISRQQENVTAGHDTIKSLRDSAREIDNTRDNFSRPENESNLGASAENETWEDEDEEAGPDAYKEDESTDPYDFDQNSMGSNSSEFEREAPVAEVNNNSFSAVGGDNSRPVDVGDYQPLDETGTQNAAPADSKLKEFFVNELKDLLWAEKKLVDTLPKMEEAATTSQLRDAFHNHLAQTEGHVERLEQIFGKLGLEPDTTKCDAMDGIVDEGEEIIDDTEEGTAQRDVGLIFAGQKVEHYEIASYGGMVSLAKTLGYTDAAAILTLTLNEEKAADALLTEIAENNVNYIAANEPKEAGLFS
jgi:uncharacterized protein (TIGR02284 family)